MKGFWTIVRLLKKLSSDTATHNEGGNMDSDVTYNWTMYLGKLWTSTVLRCICHLKKFHPPKKKKIKKNLEICQCNAPQNIWETAELCPVSYLRTVHCISTVFEEFVFSTFYLKLQYQVTVRTQSVLITARFLPH